MGNTEGERQLGRYWRGWGIILVWIIKKLGRKLWTGFTWLRM